MSRANLAVLLGVFLGGATPWLEAIVVIPGGILSGANPVLVVIAGVTGNLLTVAIAAKFGERIRNWWKARRTARCENHDKPADDEVPKTKRRQRIERLVDRWGLPALASIGPLGLGTQVSVIVAVSIGHTARRAFVWVAAGTVAWSIFAAIATTTGLSIAGIG